MKKRTDEFADLDMSKPLPNLNSIDCFGLEFDSYDRECSICSSANPCAMLFRKNIVKNNIKDIEKDRKFVDNVDFDLINKDKLAKIIRKSTITQDELYEYVKVTSKCDADILINWWIKFFLTENNFVNEDGKIYFK